jgi:hypothetical protein
MTMKSIPLALLLFGLALPLPTLAKVYTFKDWAIACDNTGHCAANGTQADDGDNPVALLLERNAGPGAALTGQLEIGELENGKIGPLALRVGKLKWNGLISDQKFDVARTERLVAAMQEANDISLTDGKHQWTLSLAGLKAVLLKMDDLQGRIGTPGALVKRGSKPESSVPPAKPAPLVAPAPLPPEQAGDKKLLPAILKQLAAQKDECWTDLPDSDQPDSSLTRLSSHLVLVLRECDRAAYQGSYKVWLANDKPPYAPKPMQFTDEDGQPTYLMNASFDKGVLSSYAKGRGINDCGSGASWAWTGKTFVLMSAEIAPQCRGIPGGVPLRTWVTRQK